MLTATRDIAQRARKANVVVQVRDARAPLSSGNPSLLPSLGSTPAVVVFSKADLAPLEGRKFVETRLKAEGFAEVVYANVGPQGSARDAKKILQVCEQVAARRTKSSGITLLAIVGVPNVGKSSLVNAVRRASLSGGTAAARVGPNAGVTRSAQTVRVSPTAYLTDTPGVTPPSVSSAGCGLKLALLGVIKDGIVSPFVVADYLLFCLNKWGDFGYVNILGLQGPTDDVTQVLGKMPKASSMSEDECSLAWIKLWRTGVLGKHCFDDINSKNLMTQGKDGPTLTDQGSSFPPDLVRSDE